jgi:hypothetical protein
MSWLRKQAKYDLLGNYSNFRREPLTATIIGREVLRLLGNILQDQDYIKLERAISASWLESKYNSLSKEELELSLDDLSEKYLESWAYELAIPMIAPEVLYYWAV